MVYILRQQRGRCAYSNIKLNYGSIFDKDWVASLERINPRLGYIKDNVCLICAEFNGVDHTKNIKYSNGGSGYWSKEKFNFFLLTITNSFKPDTNDFRKLLISPDILELINNPKYIVKLLGNVQLEIVN